MFSRLERIIDETDFLKIKQIKVLIVGLGGVGGHAFEALVRMGVVNFTVIDNDVFDVSNLNRQLLATQDNISLKKVLEAEKRAKTINSDVNIEALDWFLNTDNFDKLVIDRFDYVLDCCDTVETKILLIKKCLENNIKVISCMGSGNRFDPTKLEITNIWKTNNDPLAKKMRKLLKDNHITKKVNVVCSREIPVKSGQQIGSTSLVPSVAGIYMASFVINDIISK